MKIDETKKEFEGLMKGSTKLADWTKYLSSELVYSCSHPPQNRPVFGTSRNLVIYYDEAVMCYQAVLLRSPENPSIDAKQCVYIDAIVELYKLNSGTSVVYLLDDNADQPLRVVYSQQAQENCDLFCVELDLDRVTREFPRLVERKCDSIVFLGDVLFAGEVE